MAQTEEIRHQAAIVGRVTSKNDGRPIPSVTVTISSTSVSFAQWLALKSLECGAAWDTLTIRPDRTQTADDGHFCFPDLPDDTYAVLAAWPARGSRYGTASATATVARDANGIVMAPPLALVLAPTSIVGSVSAKGAAVPMATVRLTDSGESTFTDAAGHYGLAAIEPGQRTVRVESVGLAGAESTVKVDGAGASATLDFSSS